MLWSGAAVGHAGDRHRGRGHGPGLCFLSPFCGGGPDRPPVLLFPFPSCRLFSVPEVPVFSCGVGTGGMGEGCPGMLTGDFWKPSVGCCVICGTGCFVICGTGCFVIVFGGGCCCGISGSLRWGGGWWTCRSRTSPVGSGIVVGVASCGWGWVMVMGRLVVDIRPGIHACVAGGSSSSSFCSCSFLVGGSDCVGQWLLVDGGVPGLVWRSCVPAPFVVGREWGSFCDLWRSLVGACRLG